LFAILSTLFPAFGVVLLGAVAERTAWLGVALLGKLMVLPLVTWAMLRIFPPLPLAWASHSRDHGRCFDGQFHVHGGHPGRRRPDADERGDSRLFNYRSSRVVALAAAGAERRGALAIARWRLMARRRQSVRGVSMPALRQAHSSSAE